jgi:hypothetical protein
MARRTHGREWCPQPRVVLTTTASSDTRKNETQGTQPSCLAVPDPYASPDRENDGARRVMSKYAASPGLSPRDNVSQAHQILTTYFKQCGIAPSVIRERFQRGPCIVVRGSSWTVRETARFDNGVFCGFTDRPRSLCVAETMHKGRSPRRGPSAAQRGSMLRRVNGDQEACWPGKCNFFKSHLVLG